jgi:DNA-binding response OmpR family regulator
MEEFAQQKRKKVLVVEDDEALRKALSEKFTLEGFEVFTAQNGREGLDEALFNRPDMILLDLLMPEMNGIEMLKSLRENEWGKNASVIVLTNSTDAAHMREALESTAERFLVKSDWKLSEIVAKVKEILKMQ